MPTVALLQRDVAAKNLLHLAAQTRKVELPPGGELLIQRCDDPILAQRAQVCQNAMSHLAVQSVARLRLRRDLHGQLADGIAVGRGRVGDGETRDELGGKRVAQHALSLRIGGWGADHTRRKTTSQD